MWIWLQDGVILFKAEASAWTAAAVQLQQVWVDPQVRNRGYARRGCGTSAASCSSRCRPCLFVRPQTAPATRVYESVGMRPTITYRSLIV